MTRTTALSREVSPNIQSNGESNIQQPHKQDSSNTQNSIDLEVLTDKIERKLMQRLIMRLKNTTILHFGESLLLPIALITRAKLPPVSASLFHHFNR